jgi:predicted DNA-binding transcriptional regulator AlpA
LILPRSRREKKEMETQTLTTQLETWNARNLLTVPEVAEWACVHPKTIYRWIKEGVKPQSAGITQLSLGMIIWLAE